jgi:GNAT superfamily N-acetyltransferase
MSKQPTVIKELKNEREWKEAFPLMKQLRTHLTEERFLELVNEATEKQNYQLFSLSENRKMVALIGFMPMITLYHGKFLYICDLVTDSDMRSKGYGATLLSYVENYSKVNGFKLVSLSSGLQRKDAHCFYENKMEYDKVSYVFTKLLGGENHVHS